MCQSSINNNLDRIEIKDNKYNAKIMAIIDLEEGLTDFSLIPYESRRVCHVSIKIIQKREL